MDSYSLATLEGNKLFRPSALRARLAYPIDTRED